VPARGAKTARITRTPDPSQIVIGRAFIYHRFVAFARLSAEVQWAKALKPQAVPRPKKPLVDATTERRSTLLFVMSQLESLASPPSRPLSWSRFQPVQPKIRTKADLFDDLRRLSNEYLSALGDEYNGRKNMSTQEKHVDDPFIYSSFHNSLI
jgi:hypothetical protein